MDEWLHQGLDVALGCSEGLMGGVTPSAVRRPHYQAALGHSLAVCPGCTTEPP